jgi:transcriptional regulator GlxA family with amidase domain
MHDFSIILLSGTYASSVALTLDILQTAATLAPRIGAAAPRWRVYSASAEPVPIGNGITISANVLPKTLRDYYATWIVPGLGLQSASAARERFEQADALCVIAALQRHARAGGSIASSCTGVFLLQAADLLADRSVTTSWWLAARLQKLEPRCKVKADRMVVADGNVITAGAAFAQTDLMLHLLRTKFGAPLADAVSRTLLLDGRQAQAPYIAPMMLASGDALLSRLTQHIESQLPHPPAVSALAQEFCVSERTLSRQVKIASGLTPLALVQHIRLNRARALLESTKLSVDEIAARVGYADATALRRLMRKAMGTTPRQLRPVAVGAFG